MAFPMAKRKRTIFRLLIAIAAYMIAGPVWFTTTVHDVQGQGLVVKHYRFGVLKWMEYHRAYPVGQQEHQKGGAFLRQPDFA